jgi:hypothetical protein
LRADRKAARVAASRMPTNARRRAGQSSTIRIGRLSAVSSRKSIKSANSETEPMVSATLNSTPK